MNTISNENFRLKKEEELSPAVKSLIGIAKPSGKDEDINGRDTRMEFLSEKYGHFAYVCQGVRPCFGCSIQRYRGQLAVFSALAAKCSILITRNKKDFPNGESVMVLTPQEFFDCFSDELKW